MFNQLWNFFKGLFEVRYHVTWMADTPEKMDNRTVYVIGEDGTNWAAVFICPCGCHAEIWLNLLNHNERPVWTVDSIGGAKAHITPSVWRQTGCRSHFLIKHGRLIWAGK